MPSAPRCSQCRAWSVNLWSRCHPRPQLQCQIKILQTTVEEANAKAVALHEASQCSVQQLAATQKEAEDRDAATATLRQELGQAARTASGFVGQTKMVQQELKGMDELQEAARLSDIAARNALYMEMLRKLPGVSWNEQPIAPTIVETPGLKGEARKEEQTAESPLKPLRLSSPSPARTPAERQKIETERVTESRGAATTSWPTPAAHSPG